MQKDTGALTLDWLLGIISAKLSTSMNQRFLVDVVPCLTTLLRADSFTSLSTADVHKALANFEKRVCQEGGRNAYSTPSCSPLN